MSSENGIKVSAQVIYSGFSDYWGGDGDRWDDDKGCLFALYGPETTHNDLVQEWLEDWNAGGDFDGKDIASEVTDTELEQAIRDVFVDGLDMDSVFGPAGSLEDFDPENDESPQCIILVHIEKEETFGPCENCGGDGHSFCEPDNPHEPATALVRSRQIWETGFAPESS